MFERTDGLADMFSLLLLGAIWCVGGRCTPALDAGD